MPYTRTDLAMEAFENTEGGAVPGVGVSHWETDCVQITEVLVTDNEAARELGKPKGSYLTLECPRLLERDPEARLATASLLTEELDRLLPRREGGAPVLVVGLGNRNITPDSLGPGVVDRTLTTRHILGAPCAAGGGMSAAWVGARRGNAQSAGCGSGRSAPQQKTPRASLRRESTKN